MENTKKIKKKKKKLSFIKIIIFMLLIYLFCYTIFSLINFKVKSIVIKGNNIITDEEIIEAAKLDNYPSFFRLMGNREKKIEKLELVKDAKIKRKWDLILEINIDEEKILYKRKSDNIYVLGSGKETELSKSISGVPTLINFVPKDVIKRFNKKFSDIDASVISKVSEIEYVSNKKDNERFLFYMTDGNLVYITVTKMKKFNLYLDMISDKRISEYNGILNLDGGDFFQKKEAK